MTLVYLVALLSLTLYLRVIYHTHTSWNPSQTLVDLPIDLPFVSVIIAARNEQETIKALLDSLALSSYPSDKFEVIVIDDMSTDETVRIVQSHPSPNINLYNLQDVTETGSKKQALAYAAMKAKGEIWMYTDADCQVTKDWISKCVTTLSTTPHINVILGPVSYHNNKLSRAISKWQQLDIMGMMAVTHAGIKTQKWYIGNGANLTIRANLWKTLGYALDTQHQFASGDDVTLVQKAADFDSKSISYQLDPDYIVQTSLQDNLPSLLQQRLRWTSKNSVQSSLSQKLVMIQIFLHCTLTIGVGILSLFVWHYALLFVTLVVGKAIIDIRYLTKIQPFFKSEISTIWIAILSPVHTLYVAIFGLLALVPQRYTWKGRTTK